MSNVSTQKCPNLKRKSSCRQMPLHHAHVFHPPMPVPPKMPIFVFPCLFLPPFPQNQNVSNASKTQSKMPPSPHHLQRRREERWKGNIIILIREGNLPSVTGGRETLGGKVCCCYTRWHGVGEGCWVGGGTVKAAGGKGECVYKQAEQNIL